MRKLVHRVRGFWVALRFFVLCFPMLESVAYADSAAVLPQGMFALFGENRFFLPVTDQFDSNGNKVSLATPFNVPLGPLFGAPPAFNFGRSEVGITQRRTEMEYTVAYGLTDRLTIGAIILYVPQATTKFTFANNTAGANFGFASGTLTPCLLAGGPPCQPANLNNVNAALAKAGFKALGDRSDSGFGNIKVGGRYQYYSGDYFRGAFTGGVILPTGKEKDPDDLLGQSFGNKAWGLWGQLQNDLLFQRPGLGKQLGYPDAGDFFLNYTLKYDLALPDKQTLRVCPISNPICTTKVQLDRDIGDTITVEFQPAVGIVKGVILSGWYRYIYKLKDHFSGPAGVPVENLERFSSQQAHEFRFDLAFTSIPWVLERKFGVPFVLDVSYRKRFAGDNFVNASQYIGFTFVIYTMP